MSTQVPGEDSGSGGNTSGGSAPPAPGDDGLPNTPGTGENVCPKCSGSGKLGQESCPNCGGTGKVVEGIGGG